MATGGTNVLLQFGEGATPTRETANYTWAELYHSSVTTGVLGSTSDSSIAIVGNSNTSCPVAAKAYIDNVG